MRFTTPCRKFDSPYQQAIIVQLELATYVNYNCKICKIMYIERKIVSAPTQTNTSRIGTFYITSIGTGGAPIIVMCSQTFFMAVCW